MSEQMPTQLTCGLECEVMFAYVDTTRGEFDPNPNDPRPVTEPNNIAFEYVPRTANHQVHYNAHVTKTLNEKGILAINALDPNIVRGTSNQEKISSWLVDRENCIQIREDGVGYRYYPFEFNSPAFYYNPNTTPLEVERVLAILRNNYRIRANPSCAIHVHVGNGYNGFQPRVLRNLMAIYYTYERQFQMLLPRERIIGSNWTPSLGCSRIGDALRLRYNRDFTRLDFLDQILEIDVNKQEDVLALNEIVVKLSTERRLAANINNLDPKWDRRSGYPDNPAWRAGKRTIEFRHHHGSVDPVAINHWMRVCVKLVEKACSIKEADEAELYEKLMEDCLKPVGLGQDNVSTIKFLMWLDCPVQAYYYGKIIAKRTDSERYLREMQELETGGEYPDGTLISNTRWRSTIYEAPVEEQSVGNALQRFLARLRERKR